MSVTFKVTWPGGCKYYKTLPAARKAFNNDSDPEDDSLDAPMAKALSKVWLTPDAFERCYNGSGGFEDNEVVLKGEL